MSATINVPYEEARTGEWAGVRAKAIPQSPRPDVLRAMHWSRRALGAAYARCANNQSDAFLTWTAAVEGVWWALALDEELTDQMKQIYPDARSQDAYGQTVGGLRWLRNRHAHEIVVTGEGGPKRDFFGKPGDGYMFYISPSNRWRTRAEIAAQRDESTEKVQERYDNYVARRPIDDTLYRATIWFDRVFSACGYPDLAEAEDKTIL